MTMYVHTDNAAAAAATNGNEESPLVTKKRAEISSTTPDTTVATDSCTNSDAENDLTTDCGGSVVSAVTAPSALRKGRYSSFPYPRSSESPAGTATISQRIEHNYFGGGGGAGMAAAHAHHRNNPRTRMGYDDGNGGVVDDGDSFGEARSTVSYAYYGRRSGSSRRGNRHLANRHWRRGRSGGGGSTSSEDDGFGGGGGGGGGASVASSVSGFSRSSGRSGTGHRSTRSHHQFNYYGGGGGGGGGVTGPSSAAGGRKYKKSPSPRSVVDGFPPHQDGHHYPTRNEIIPGGLILSRCTPRSLLLKRWKPTYWVRYGPSSIVIFRSEADYQEWKGTLGAEYTLEGREARRYVKKVFDFDTVSAIRRQKKMAQRRDAPVEEYGSGSMRVLRYGIMDAKSKKYQWKGPLLNNFKLNHWTDAGPGTAAAFASDVPSDLSSLRMAMIDCMEYCAERQRSRRRKKAKKRMRRRMGGDDESGGMSSVGGSSSAPPSHAEASGSTLYYTARSHGDGGSVVSFRDQQQQQPRRSDGGDGELRAHHLKSLEIKSNNDSYGGDGFGYVGTQHRPESLVSGVSSLSNVSSHVNAKSTRRRYAAQRGLSRRHG